MRLSKTLGLTTVCLMAMAAGTAFGAIGDQLVYNGDFSIGTAGYSTAYSLVSQNTGPGQQGVVTNPTLPSNLAWNPNFESFGDHTTGSGLMLIADGSTNAVLNPLIWGQAVTVTAGEVYSYSFWGAKASNIGTSDASLTMTINNNHAVNLDLSGSTAGTWHQSGVGTWTANYSGTAILRLYNNTFTATGNDFAVDDISMTVVPEPTSLALLGFGSLLGLGVYTRRRRRTA